MSRYDAIVIGAGAGGGIAACVLAEGGKHVLLLERGKQLTFRDEPRDHLRNHRFTRYGDNTGLDAGNPRVLVDSRGEHVLRPRDGGYNAIAAAVGGGTLVYGGQAWRFHPLDFKMASTYGVPEGSSLVDWPLTYEDLEPFYERAEWDIGVSGGPPAPQMPPRKPYPMPAFERTTKAKRLEAGAAALGWTTQSPPILFNSVPRHGRGACVRCQQCVGFQCPSDAKSGSQNTVIPRALATGRCELIAEAMVTAIESRDGHATGVRYVLGDEERVATAGVVVVAAGAIETARLLLLSGLGNAHDQVGRNLQGHYYAMAASTMQDPVWDGVGPGVTISTLEFNHGNEGVIGGGMLADDFIILPIHFARQYRPADVPAWGQAYKTWMRETYPRFVQVAGPIHEITSADARVTLDPTVRDRFGLPVARLSGTTHPETVRTTKYMLERAKEWLRASGATRVWSGEPGLGLSGGQHQAGTCRMGHDPAVSAVDLDARVHGTDNVYVADGAVHPTNGGFNPVLTIMAMAYRTSTRLLDR